jgi:release factor glutamine methyltransferase
VVSNPPYITPREKEDMHANVLQHEPHLALFITEEEPLLFYKAITQFAATHLNKDGLLYFEINAAYGNEVKRDMEIHGFTSVQIIKDMQGKDRMVKGSLA